MNDSVRFDAKEGFILNPKRLEKLDGTYLCIADYNNTFQIIKYNVMRDDGPNSGSGTGNLTLSLNMFYVICVILIGMNI